MNPCPERRDHGFDLSISVNTVQPRLFHVQDLTAKRKDRLCRARPCRLRGTACGISLDDKYFTVFRILICTVRQLSGQRHAVQRVLSSRHFAGLARRLPGSLGQNGFRNDRLSDCRILLKEDLHLLGNDRIDRSARF